MVSGVRPLLPIILGQIDPIGEKTSIFNRYSLVAYVSAVTPSEKVQLK